MTKTFKLRAAFQNTSRIVYIVSNVVKAFSEQIGNTRINVYTGKLNDWTPPKAVFQFRTGAGQTARYDYADIAITNLAAATGRKFMLPVAWKRGSAKWKSFVGVNFFDRTYGDTRVRLYYDKDARAVYLGLRTGSGSDARYSYRVLSKPMIQSKNWLGSIAL